jgi:uncharacterized protein (TIGR00251 family)
MPSENIGTIRKELNGKKSVSLKIKVKTNALKNEIIGLMPDGTVKISIKSAPEKGRANKELVFFLARTFDVPRENVKIVSGASSRQKMVKIRK